jgi:AcrR family transcriptional regulator
METTLPNQHGVATHQQMRSYSNDLLRRNVIEAASQLLRDEGPDALTVRRVAEVLDCSTKIIYTTFKGKDGLADALFLEGCAGLAQAIGRVPRVSTPATYLWEISCAYWTFALANTSYYRVMFCGAIPNYQPAAASLRTTTTALEAVVKAIQQYQQEGKFPLDDPILITKALWAALHGVVSLYLQGHFTSHEEATSVFERTVQAALAPFASAP